MNEIHGRKKTPVKKTKPKKRKTLGMNKSNISGNEISDIAACQSLDLISPKLTTFADEDWLQVIHMQAHALEEHA